MFYASVPDDYRNKWNGGVFNVWEHAGTLWLWAHPGLLGWKFEIRWLFSPINTGPRSPGDLWGVDSLGNLLIVENKRAGGGDPFQDFIGFLEDYREPGIAADELLDKWEGLLTKEIESAPLWREDPAGTYPGVLPYSRHRAELRRWPDLTDKVEGIVLGRTYKRDVQRKLKEREMRGSPPPIYVGFFTCSSPRLVKATPKTIKSQRRLANGSNPRQTLLTAACARRISNKKVQIVALEVISGDPHTERNRDHSA
ncbi:MAG: hypothetical protein JRJ03_18000 [Deltaproteobacteria bacterium]|nr:hypothetical protein [Deltaproteobacteria bacterium]